MRAPAARDFGGSGLGVGDPKGLGKALERCVQALVHGGRVSPAPDSRPSAGASTCVFVCVESADGDAACLAKATAEVRARVRPRAAREVGKLTVRDRQSAAMASTSAS